VANTFAFAEIASIMFAMDAMLTRRSDQLKMPRQDAYCAAAMGLILSSRPCKIHFRRICRRCRARRGIVDDRAALIPMA